MRWGKGRASRWWKRTRWRWRRLRTSRTPQNSRSSNQKAEYMSRKPLFAANWKMFKTPDEAVDFTRKFVPTATKYKQAEIVLCASPTLLPSVVDAAHNSPLRVAAQ